MNSINNNYIYNKVPFDDEKTWDLICSGRTIGVFQLESQLGQAWAKKLKPRSIEELSDLIAILRPSCLESGMADLYIKIKNKEVEPEYLHEALIPILEKTRSCLIYQEQSMRIGIDIAGMTPVESDKYIRKGIGKKIPEVIAECKKIFIEGCTKKGLVNKADAEKIFSWIEKAQRYQFNKCLSPYTCVELDNGTLITLKDVNIGEKIKAPVNNKDTFVEVLNKYNNGPKELVRIYLKSGKSIDCTLDHKFLTNTNEILPLSEILGRELEIMCED